MDRSPTVRVDFQNADAQGRVRLNTVAALEDLAEVELRNGSELRLVDAELRAVGRAVHSEDEQLWVAEVDWSEILGG